MMTSEDFKRGVRDGIDALWSYFVDEDGLSIVRDPDYGTLDLERMASGAYDDAVRWEEIKLSILKKRELQKKTEEK